MQKRKFSRAGAGEASLPELLDQLELTLAGTPVRVAVCRALSDLNRRLGSASGKAAAMPIRSKPPRHQGQHAVESLPLFS